ncbi:prevent-host-death protein [Tolypothrix tenuis PCC 7101]|uniref:Prevent-host-death protein n=1 Tax=Tolypothrix tenuis PCC 7101 TaxID=231146 RepID=A0A1Z4MVH9_9CYAN|nr:type II toxin-antitoxin system Phd/YefM family antitoxin [Aulosira sp. FACHB-113]BAY97421.1 prevent-host-death protein [Tolypothrix tenuis PCC 7101]BAZ72070.1 prevent-host-death protein [Aulosira laxa NIES-50]
MQKDFAKYPNRFEAGDSFTILPADKSTTELPAITITNKQQRPFGLCAGEFKVPDDFDAPLPEDIISAFEVG